MGESRSFILTVALRKGVECPGRGRSGTKPHGQSLIKGKPDRLKMTCLLVGKRDIQDHKAV